jgi:hypothetical protein
MALQRLVRARVQWGTISLAKNAAIAAVVVAALTLASAPVVAVGFDYAMDELRITGNLEFFDDFEDGSRATPPTSAFEDFRTTVSIEEGGFLILNSDNGYYPRPDLGQDLDWVEGAVDLTTPIVDGESGTTTISAHFRPDFPAPGSDGPMVEHYGILLGTGPSDVVEIGVQRFTPAWLRIFFYDDRFFDTPNPAAGRLGHRFVRTSSVTGNIVLELVVDHATDTVTPRLDGGATFVDGSLWGVFGETAQPGPVFDTGDEAFVARFAFGP